MSESQDNHMLETAQEWLRARACIVDFLRELRPDMTTEQHEHNAAAIIARLAHLEPPMTVAYFDRLKE